MIEETTNITFKKLSDGGVSNDSTTTKKYTIGSFTFHTKLKKVIVNPMVDESAYTGDSEKGKTIGFRKPQ